MKTIKSVFGAVATIALAALSLGVGAAPAQAANNCGTLQVNPIHSDTFYIDNAAGFDAAYIGYSVKNNGASATTSRSLQINSFTGGTVTFSSNEISTRSLGTIAAGATKYVYFLAKSSALLDDLTDTAISVSVKSSSSTLCTITDTITKVDDVLSTNASTISTVSASPNTSTVVAGTDITVTVVGDSGNIGSGDNNDPNSIMMSPVTISTAFDAAHYRLKSARYVATAGGCDLQDKLRFISLPSACDGTYTATYVFETLATANQTIASEVQGETYIASGANIKHPDALPFELPLVQTAQKIVYKGNGGLGTMETVEGAGGLSVDGNLFVYDCHIFAGFNTRADGNGDAYAENDEYAEGGTLTLYAQWDVDPTCSAEELAAAGQLANTGSAATGLAFAGALLLLAGLVVVRRQRA